MKHFSFLIYVIALVLCAPAYAEKWIDLSYEFDAETIYWPTADNFELESVHHGKSAGGYFYSANNYAAAEHGGTHMDAPIHFYEKGHGASEVPLERLIGPASVIDVSARALKNPDYQIRVRDITQWEAKHGRLPDNTLLLFYTGFAQFWPDKEKYMGTQERGGKAVPKLHFPGIHPRAAQWLVDNRNIALVGLDTPSLDYGQSRQFETHQILSAENMPGLENLANLDKLPPTGSTVFALPMKIKGGSGAPARVIARIP